jgi:hypothetical protein
MVGRFKIISLIHNYIPLSASALAKSAAAAGVPLSSNDVAMHALSALLL